MLDLVPKRQLTSTVYATTLMTPTTDLGLSIRVSIFETGDWDPLRRTKQMFGKRTTVRLKSGLDLSRLNLLLLPNLSGFTRQCLTGASLKIRAELVQPDGQTFNTPVIFIKLIETAQSLGAPRFRVELAQRANLSFEIRGERVQVAFNMTRIEPVERRAGSIRKIGGKPVFTKIRMHRG